MHVRGVFLGLVVLILVAIVPFTAFASGKQDSGPASAIPPGPYGKYDPPITLEFFKYIGSDGLERIRDGLTAVTGETVEDNRWTQMYLEKMGVNITYKWVADSAQGGAEAEVGDGLGRSTRHHNPAGGWRSST